MTARRVSTAHLLCLLLLLVACGVGGTRQEAPVPPEATTPGEVGTPGAVAADQRFSLDDIAEYPDGLAIEVTGAVATRAEAKDRGAESTGGEIITAAIRIENQRDLPYEATSVRVFASYGDGTAAPMVLDNTGELQRGFTAIVPAREEATAPVAFAIPFAALNKVTFVVDPSDDEHEPVSFTGPIERQ